MSEPFGGLPDRFEPAGPVAGLGLILPGSGYGPAQPLLEYARQALLHAGWVARQVWWTTPRELDDPTAWVREQAVAALADEPSDLPLLIVGKSLGTLAAPYAADREAPAIWLTPLLTRPEVVDAIRANPARQLLVGGTADDLWDADVAADLAAGGCEVLQVDGADHGMIVRDDPVHSAEILVEVTRAMVRFVAA